MDVLCSSLQNKLDRGQSSQSVRDCRLAPGDPNRVRNSDGIGGEVLRFTFHKAFEVGASDFLFELPDELDVHGSSLFDSVTRAKQGGERGTFIVCGPASDVAAVFVVKDERGASPLGLVCGLNVEMVVDGYRRPVVSRGEFSYDDRIAGRGNRLRLGP